MLYVVYLERNEWVNICGKLDTSGQIELLKNVFLKTLHKWTNKAMDQTPSFTFIALD